jgi:hypothetical protein
VLGLSVVVPGAASKTQQQPPPPFPTISPTTHNTRFETLDIALPRTFSFSTTTTKMDVEEQNNTIVKLVSAIQQQ